MKIQQQAALKQLNYFGVEATASQLLHVENEEDLLSLPVFDSRQDVVLGGGSNVLFVSDVPGTVFLNRIQGLAIIEEHDDQVLIEAGAGENWHELVLWSLEQGLSGLENLSLIPGLAGAAPVQNIGAYGVELSSVLENVTAWDLSKTCWTRFNRSQCLLQYRDSLFKSTEPNRYLITSIRLRLGREFFPRLEYTGLKDELRAMNIDSPNASQVSEAVIRLRKSKLPDPERIGNAGSFFKNPSLGKDQAEQLRSQCSGIPAWPDGPKSTKFSAAWLIEKCGLKGYRSGDAGVSPTHALVLVNYGSASGLEIAELAQTIKTKVFNEFGIRLEQEPVQIQF